MTENKTIYIGSVNSLAIDNAMREITGAYDIKVKTIDEPHSLNGNSYSGIFTGDFSKAKQLLDEISKEHPFNQIKVPKIK